MSTPFEVLWPSEAVYFALAFAASITVCDLILSSFSRVQFPFFYPKTPSTSQKTTTTGRRARGFGDIVRGQTKHVT